MAVQVQKLRVLLINPVAQLGGAERVLLDFIASARTVSPVVAFHLLTFSDGPLLLAAQRLGATASVLTLPRRLATLGDSRLLGSQNRRHSLKLLSSLVHSVPSIFRFRSALRAEIRRQAPDVVHSNGIKAHLLAGLATPAGIPLIWHIHDFFSERPLTGRILKLLSGRANAVIAVSAAVADDARRLLPSLRVITILNGVDLEHFSPGPPDGPSLDRLAGMGPASVGTLRIGLVATYARWKGQDTFLRAAAHVHKSVPARPLRFYVVGGPIYATDASQFTSKELRGLIAELKLAETAGLIPFQEDIPPLLRSLDIVVHASNRPEPFGRTIVEAMACARPLVAAVAGGAREIVQARLTGLTHIPGDVEGLASALVELIEFESLRSRLAAEARRVAVADFSRDRLGPALVALYESLVSRAPSSWSRADSM